MKPHEITIEADCIVFAPRNGPAFKADREHFDEFAAVVSRIHRDAYPALSDEQMAAFSRKASLAHYPSAICADGDENKRYAALKGAVKLRDQLIREAKQS